VNDQREGDDLDTLHFEHLVEVDGGQPEIPHIGALRLWQGLKLRVEFPQTFQPALDRCELQIVAEDELLRTLHFGQHQVRDHVRIDPSRQRIDIKVIAAAEHMQAHMTMQVEQPDSGGLWVRFSYAVRSPDHSAESPLGGFVKDAWRQADEETVFRIRQLAATGVLDGARS
jgi:hypothetical protein